MLTFPLKYATTEKGTKQIVEILDYFPPIDIDIELADWLKKQIRG